MTTSDSVQPLTAADIMAEHRLCGRPKYDGCYAHFPMPHCRADGMAWPCDVDRLRALDEARAGSLDALGDIAENMNHTPHVGGRYDWCGPCRAAAALREAQP